jgi:hypothetical protein
MMGRLLSYLGTRVLFMVFRYLGGDEKNNERERATGSCC